MTKSLFIITLGFIGLLCVGPGISAPARAEEPPTIEVMIKDHRFSPAEIHVPRGKPVILRITNADDTVEEFDSVALQLEKLIVGGHYATVRLRPLGPGRFPFMGEYHSATAQGAVVSDP
jgi:heme/copper-type cytochrome/quinol oxidase subunit 2